MRSANMFTPWSFHLLPVLQTVQAAMSIVVFGSRATNPVTYAIDGNAGPFWHSEYSLVLDLLPHTIYLDTGSSQVPDGFTYLPRLDGKTYGRIGAYSLADNKTWTTVAPSTFQDDATKKNVGFANTQARYFRPNATSEAGNPGNWTRAAEFGFSLVPTAVGGLGEWGPLISMPLIPTAGFIEYSTGNMWTFAAYDSLTFKIGLHGEIYDAEANTWSLLPGFPVASILTADAQGAFRTDNHAW
ncbi:hypothetical protein NHQ30_009901 [Ciborinia camelliae]|nr:hypothetical protein NHQ30_009901 [Ciborinia camelliae]